MIHSLTLPNVARREAPVTELDSRWLPVKDAAKYIGVSRETIFRMLADGRLASVTQYRPNQRRLYLWQPDLDAWMQTRMVRPVDQADAN